MNNMAKDVDTSTQEVETPAVASEETTNLQNDVYTAMNMLSSIYEGFYSILDESAEIEQKLATTDMSAVAEQFTKLVASIQDRFESLKNKAATAETELTTIKEAQAQAELERAAAEKLEDRKNRLTQAGIELTDEKKEFYIGMADTIFDQYISDITAVMSKANAEQNNKAGIIPEPTGSGNSNSGISTKELAAFIVAELKK
jgi:paraquat-inducible protein B